MAANAGAKLSSHLIDELFVMTAVGMRWHNITVPERQLTPVLTTPRKPFSQRFWDLLASESGAPMWPDAPQLAEGPRNTGVEHIGKTLDYTIQTWKSGRCTSFLKAPPFCQVLERGCRTAASATLCRRASFEHHAQRFTGRAFAEEDAVYGAVCVETR